MLSRSSLLSPLLLLAACAVAVPAAAQAHKAHSHGIAELEVAIDGPLLTLKLESPLDSLLGFERAPRNDAERERVRVMAQALRSGPFVPTAAARCRLERVSLSSAALAPDLLGEPGPAAGGKTSSEHADLDAGFVYRCDEPKALTGIDVMLFDHFKRLRRVDTQVAGPKGQAALKLTSKSRQIRW
jgi:hypothetical protein